MEVLLRLGDWVWGFMLWFMRRPPVKWLRFRHVYLFPEARRERAWARFCRQERWARRYGRLIMRFFMAFIVFVTAFQLMGAWVVNMQSQGSLPSARAQE